MMSNGNHLSRRDFIKVLSAHMVAAFLPNFESAAKPMNHFKKPVLNINDLSSAIQSILKLMPKVVIDEDGYAIFSGVDGQRVSRIPVVQTQWNLERSNPFERLFDDQSWAIVLHWFGATLEGNANLAGYLRGFDGLRQVRGYHTRTSAHFLVGDGMAISNSRVEQDEISIVQTQIPDQDGTPFVASHLAALDYDAHRRGEQYFVRAWYQLSYLYPGVHSLLTDFYDGPLLDPNYRTIAIELTGFNFDQDRNFPSAQKIANTISLVCALMKRYQIPIQNLMGHHEIELLKSDPGKVFLNVIRFLIGINALVSGDEALQLLVFGSFKFEKNRWIAVSEYFRFIRDYLVLVAYPDQIYTWEGKTNYWIVLHSILAQISNQKQSRHLVFDRMMLPLKEEFQIKRDSYLLPEQHTGVDIYVRENSSPFEQRSPVNVYLPASGECLYTGREAICKYGYVVIFKHVQPDGASVLTIFGNLQKLASLKIGQFYPMGWRIGAFERGSSIGEGCLHFAVAYGASWETVLRSSPVVSSLININWIQRRFLSPLDYIARWDKLPSTN
jgi:hypothetical protein